MAGLSASLPGALHIGLTAQGVPDQAVAAVATVPPVSLMAFAGAVVSLFRGGIYIHDDSA